jgi:crotonobetainyl-CoA:carnitine CoA-transferase CaiB-like acyl-CoA transferase
MTDARPLPLAGIRVLDFGHILAGPFCARMLADLGAEVVKVETATRQGRLGARRGGARAGNTSGRTALLAHINRNRRSIDLNLKTERGLDIARRLAAKADVLIENFSAGVMDRLGLGYADLAATNPRLVYASMSAYGHTGPHRGWTGMNVTLQACSGLMMATGEPGDPPIGISNSWNDYIGGLHAATAIVGALGKRKMTGRGQHLDVSQFECSVAMIGSLLLASTVENASPARRGNRSSLAAPQGCYRCAGDDQWCAISVRDDAQWRAFAPELGDIVRRYPTLADRQAHHDEIDGTIEAWTKTLAPAEVERRLVGRGIAAAAMRRGNDIAEVEEWRRVLHPIEGLGEPGTRVVGLPFSFRGARPVEAAAAPHLGEHGREVLRDWLDLDEEVAA